MNRQRGYYDPGKKPFPQNHDRAAAPLAKKRPTSPADRHRLERAEAKRRRKGKR